MGVTITTGANAVQVTQLGRYFLFGNTGSHTVKIVNASTGVDVSGGSVTVNLTDGQSGAFIYETLASPVTLNPNTSYYIVSQETQGGDLWYNYTFSVNTTNAVTDTAGVSSSDGTTYTQQGGTNNMYGAMSFIYLLP